MTQPPGEMGQLLMLERTGEQGETRGPMRPGSM